MSNNVLAIKNVMREGSGDPCPKLRFSEFQADSEPWDYLKLAEVLREHGIKGDSVSEVFSVSVHKGIVNQIEHLGRSFAATSTTHYNVVKPFDVVYTKSPTGDFPYGIVKQSRLLKDVLVSPLYGVFEPINPSVGQLVHSFFESPIRTKHFLEPLVQKGAKNTVQISNDRFLSGLVWLPRQVEEQRKISDCLLSADELIAAGVRRVEALRSHKRALMQQLLPRDGETHPRLRFPEFQDQPKWERVALGAIAEVKLGKMLDSRKHTTGRLMPYLNNASVRWNDVDTSNLPQMYFNDDELERFGLWAGDVVVCEGGEPGRAVVWDGRFPDLKFQKAIHRVRFNVPFEPRMLVLYLEAVAGTKHFEMLFTGGGIKHLTQETFAQLMIPHCSHAEQKRIASCFSALDDLIAAVVQELESLKRHKQAMMQQLFPVIVLDEER